MQELTSDNLNEVISQNKKVVVQYGAGWCGACRMIKPQFKRMSEDEANADIAFFYVDAENFPESRGLAKVENLPTFAGFVDGKLIKQTMGTKAEAIKGLIDEVASN
jgi:thioredoxin 1